MEYPEAFLRCHTYVKITWDTPTIYIIMLKVFGKLLLPQCSHLMVLKVFSYSNGFSVSLSSILPVDNGVAALMLVTAVKPCHIYSLPRMPPWIFPEHPLLEVLCLTMHPVVTFIFQYFDLAMDNSIICCISHPI